MSYVKMPVLYKGKEHVFEVHGSELKIDVRKKVYSSGNKRINIPQSIKTSKQYIDWANKNNIIVSGTTQDRFGMGIPEIKSEEDKPKFFNYLKKMDLRGNSDSSKPFEYNSIIDFDHNIFHSMKANWYDNYSAYIPSDWVYKEYTTPEEERKILYGFVFSKINKTKSKKPMGWRQESARHSMARKKLVKKNEG